MPPRGRADSEFSAFADSDGSTFLTPALTAIRRTFLTSTCAVSTDERGQLWREVRLPISSPAHRAASGHAPVDRCAPPHQDSLSRPRREGMRATLAALVALVLLSGCTPTVLREHSVSLAGSSSDLRYREVMENLAMIYANPCTLPAYSSVYSGGMDVQDGVQIDGTTTWAHAIPTPSGFSSQTLDIPLSRSIKGTLTLDPTIVPEKLRALRA